MSKMFYTVGLLILLFNEGEASKSKLFAITGFTFSIMAIVADIEVEHFYDKYQNATLPDDCIHYRNMTQFYEKVRDISFGLSVVNFSLSTIFLLKEKKKLETGFYYKKGKVCLFLKRLLY
ncbi:MAG: hypothetical protein N3A65_10040 [candidate division WOR-3 bacterium]|nr:hypothetical protein [candidate division WOR-3 bacterium]